MYIYLTSYIKNSFVQPSYLVFKSYWNWTKNLLVPSHALRCDNHYVFQFMAQIGFANRSRCPVRAKKMNNDEPMRFEASLCKQIIYSYHMIVLLSSFSNYFVTHTLYIYIRVF